MGRPKKNKKKNSNIKASNLNKSIAGVDEVGRGSLIGPVYAAAVILNESCNLRNIKDSKTLSKKKRELLSNYIKKNSIWAIGKSSAKEIDKINILKASLRAMERAIKKLNKKPSRILVDGNKVPNIKKIEMKAIIKGDQKIPEISAASIIAKVSRDKYIISLARKYSNYFWNKNFGYATKEHIRAIKKYGINKHYRKTFTPIKK